MTKKGLLTGAIVAGLGAAAAGIYGLTRGKNDGYAMLDETDDCFEEVTEEVVTDTETE
jgi:hypothetical protein